ncbi:single-stranded DNA-binding protein [Streptomyces formicae]|uniref:Single-stranded DNA-binding protein n=1 Tax=Streptomyces formicae TaxID=1616117 RepID=A0ABY3WRF2_9ACTN|nr:single-stranded DNA-binding protein [Streptomyces formicae]UNM15229.1 single-stranded DNA-binding protein [Streptomyces formicae]
MNETTVTLVGNVATAVEYRESESGGYARFRFAVTSRRWDRLREVWADGPTSFYTVWASRTLGLNLAASVSVGEPLVVHGRLKVREEERDGVRRSSAEVDAVAAGHDLTRGTSAFRRAAKGDPYPADRDRSAGRAGASGAANAVEHEADGTAPAGPAPVTAGAVADAVPAPPF